MRNELVGPLCIILVFGCFLGIALYLYRRSTRSKSACEPESRKPGAPQQQLDPHPKPSNVAAAPLPDVALDSPQPTAATTPQPAAVPRTAIIERAVTTTAVARKDAASKLPALPERFVVFDLETTGLSAGLHEIIEFGAIRVNSAEGTLDSFQAFVRPENKVPHRITEITGITQEMVDCEGGDLGDMLREFVEFIGDLPLVAFNASFDMGFLQNAASQHGLAIGNSYTCAMALARRTWPDLDSHSLPSLAKWMHIS
jgi:DNA polymerase III subunit epsilon